MATNQNLLPKQVPDAPATGGRLPLFDHEKLDVYKTQLQFIAWVTLLLDEVSQQKEGRTREVCDQLDRASLSALLNTAEGNGKRQRPVRARFFDDARGSAMECAACLDALVAKRAAGPDRVIEGKRMLLRTVSMLCGLVERFGSSEAFRDASGEYCDREPQPEKLIYRVGNPRTRTRTRRKASEGT